MTFPFACDYECNVQNAVCMCKKASTATFDFSEIQVKKLDETKKIKDGMKRREGALRKPLLHMRGRKNKIFILPLNERRVSL